MNVKQKNIKKEPELRPEYIKKLKRIIRGKHFKSLRFKSIDESRKSIESK